MTRETLSAALVAYDNRQSKLTSGSWLGAVEPMAVAARERLTQLGEKCGTCDGEKNIFDSETGDWVSCPTCHGFGKVWPAGLVERIRTALRGWDLDFESTEASIAVLDALASQVGEPGRGVHFLSAPVNPTEGSAL